MQRKSTQKQRNLNVHEQSNDFAKIKHKEQRQCKIMSELCLNDTFNEDQNW